MHLLSVEEQLVYPGHLCRTFQSISFQSSLIGLRSGEQAIPSENPLTTDIFPLLGQSGLTHIGSYKDITSGLLFAGSRPPGSVLF